MILNPRTNRMLKIGSSSHLKAVAQGILPKESLAGNIEPDADNDPIVEEPTRHKIEPRIKIDPRFSTDEGIAEICSNIIVKKKQEFKKLSQDETDQLIKELLYKKLYGNKSKSKKSKIKVKKNKKNYSSEDDSDESS